MKADVDDYLKVPYFDTDYLNNLNICISFSVYFPLWVWFLCLYSGVNTLLTFWLMSIVNPFNCIWTIFADGPTRFLISEWTEAEIAPSTQWGCFCWYPLQCTTDQFSCALCRNAGILEFWSVMPSGFLFSRISLLFYVTETKPIKLCDFWNIIVVCCWYILSICTSVSFHLETRSWFVVAE